MLPLFGAAAVSVMLLAYALEERAAAWVLVFALACAASSLYGWLAGTWAIRGRRGRVGAGGAAALARSSLRPDQGHAAPTAGQRVESPRPASHGVARQMYPYVRQGTNGSCHRATSLGSVLNGGMTWRQEGVGVVYHLPPGHDANAKSIVAWRIIRVVVSLVEQAIRSGQPLIDEAHDLLDGLRSAVLMTSQLRQQQWFQ